VRTSDERSEESGQTRRRAERDTRPQAEKAPQATRREGSEATDRLPYERGVGRARLNDSCLPSEARWRRRLRRAREGGTTDRPTAFRGRRMPPETLAFGFAEAAAVRPRISFFCLSGAA